MIGERLYYLEDIYPGCRIDLRLADNPGVLNHSGPQSSPERACRSEVRENTGVAWEVRMKRDTE